MKCPDASKDEVDIVSGTQEMLRDFLNGLLWYNVKDPHHKQTQ